jgi:2,4-dienoyl-CoA reductase-like NADH-dependent reductase (Old Yellow Enzyme family)
MESGARYPHVFSPVKLGPVEVANRIYMAPHGIGLDTPSPDYGIKNVPAAEHAFYFAERAAGGTALIFHSMVMGPFATQPRLQANPGTKEAIPSYRRVADLVHEHDARIMAEIWYVPWQPHSWDALGPEAPALSPSANQQYGDGGTRYALRKRDLKLVVDAHATAVSNLREAGYDGVELHVSHGALLEHFLSERYNRRTDEYGGPLENRARLLREALEAARGAAGDAMAVGIRLTADQMLPWGWDTDGAREILEHLAPTGLLDFVDIDISVEPEQVELLSTSFFIPKLHNLERVEAVAPAAGDVPVLATPGRVTTIADAERLLAGGSVAMVGIVRGLIAEPELVKNAREGNESRSRVCIAANHCAGGVLGFGCAVNPAAAREERWGLGTIAAAPKSMKVTVVGGGPGGLEAARVAALRGHPVTLLEARPDLGGALGLWARLPGRESLQTLPAWYAARLAELGVDVRTGVAADEQTVLATEPEVVFVATGGAYDRSGESGYAPRPIAGWERELVVAPEAVLTGERELSGRVLVLDDEGYHCALGIAELAAGSGCEVELVTRHASAGARLTRDASQVLGRLRAAGVRITTGTFVDEIGEGSVTLRDLTTKQQRTVAVDAAVIATMRKPVDALADALDGKVAYVYPVGDALAPRTLREATYEGHRFARLVGEDDMPATVIEELFRPFGHMRPAAHV